MAHHTSTKVPLTSPIAAEATTMMKTTKLVALLRLALSRRPTTASLRIHSRINLAINT